MNIFLMAYARKNLGDDLFIKMLLDRYPEHNFFMKIENFKYLDNLSKYNNLNVLIGPDTDEELYNSNVNDYDAYIYIGGSIFMEGGSVYNLSEKFYDFILRCNQNNKPFCYVSSNYGPYYTNEFLELSRKAFKECTDICFRDKYSYEMFKDSEKVRYAPDIIFSYDIKNSLKISNSVGITVIDLGIREKLKDNKEAYMNSLIQSIKTYLQENKKVYLFSFCKAEGDEKAISEIMKKFNNNKNIIEVKYDGDIDKFLEIYAKMEYMICAKFHAMVLSSILGQKMYVMSYSKKINNVISDLELNLPVLSLNKLNKPTIFNLKSFRDIDETKLKQIKIDAKNQELVVKNIFNKK